MADMDRTRAAGAIVQPNTAPAAGERELRIEFFSRGYDAWVGTRTQLEDEGLIPAAFEWPTGTADRHWEAGGFTVWLRRVKPENFKGPMKAWLECDNFAIRRRLITYGLDGFAAASLYEKRLALADELWSRTPAAHQLRRRWCTANQDRVFQAFKAQIPA